MVAGLLQLLQKGIPLLLRIHLVCPLSLRELSFESMSLASLILSCGLSDLYHPVLVFYPWLVFRQNSTSLPPQHTSFLFRRTISCSRILGSPFMLYFFRYSFHDILGHRHTCVRTYGSAGEHSYLTMRQLTFRKYCAQKAHLSFGVRTPGLSSWYLTRKSKRMSKHIGF